MARLLMLAFACAGFALISCSPPQNKETPKNPPPSSVPDPKQNAATDANKKKPDEPEQKKEKPADRKPDFTVTAQVLDKEESDDKKAAIKKYDGKIVEVTGEVVLVFQDEISLRGNTFVATVRFGVLPEYRPLTHRLSTGQKVKILCKVSAPFGLSYNESSVVELEPSKIEKVTAEQLVNFKDAKKYDVRWIVTGEVLDVSEPVGMTEYKITLKGTAKTQLVIQTSFQDKKDVPKKGEKVEFGVAVFGDKGDNLTCFGFLMSSK